MGYVYKDENGDSKYNSTTDIPIAGAIVKTISNGEEVVVSTNENGKYELDVPPGGIYPLEVSRAAGIECYSPQKDVWSTNHSTITGRQTIVIPSKSAQFITADIPIEYLPLNYGPHDFSYEIWHYGPIIKSAPDTILVHGALIPGEGRKLKEPNNLFHQLGSLLQSKKYGKQNVWDFEYGNNTPFNDGNYYNYGDLKNFGCELMLAISKIKTLNSSNNVNIIAHSMGGLVAMYAAENIQDVKINKIITLDTGYFGFEMAEFSSIFVDKLPKDIRENALCVDQTRPGNEFLYSLAKNFTRNKVKTLSLAAGEPLLNFKAVVSPTSSSLVQINSDGSVSYDDINLPFIIVNGVDHKSISEIDNVNHPAFGKIVRFLKDGSVDLRDITRPSGMPYFTVVFKNTPQSGFPKLWSFETSSSNETLLNSVPAIRYAIENDQDGYHAVTFKVKEGQEGSIFIEYAKNQFVDGRLVKSQSTIRMEVIPN